MKHAGLGYSGTRPVHVERYGENVVGIPKLSGGSCWVREDVYTSFRTAEPHTERRFCSGASDETPLFSGQYSSKCPCCWLGFSHTEGYHTAMVAEGAERGPHFRECREVMPS